MIDDEKDIDIEGTLTYWYDNGMGSLCFNSARADNSEIVPIEEGETPFVRIVTYYTQEVRINKSSGKEYISNENWCFKIVMLKILTNSIVFYKKYDIL